MNWHLDQNRVSNYQLYIFCPLPSVRPVMLDGQRVTCLSRAVLVFFFLFYPCLYCQFTGTCWKKVVVHGGKSNYPIFWPIYLSMHVPKLDHGWLIMLQRCWSFHKQNTTILCTWHVRTKVGHIIRTKRKGYIRTKQGLTFSFLFLSQPHVSIIRLKKILQTLKKGWKLKTNRVFCFVLSLKRTV
jgi:hypothetical protein